MIERLRNIYRKLKLVVICERHKDNLFIKDLSRKCIEYKVKLNDILFLIYLNYEYVDIINDCLYNFLSDDDKDMILRFYIKRYIGYETISEDEKAIIDEAFMKTERLCAVSDGEARCDFSFQKNHIRFAYPFSESEGSFEEKRLMDYYPVAHCFFLKEYEKDGFNPEDGGVIFDCGAAYGDTAIFFSVLYPQSKIISFEYGDQPLEYANQNIKENNILNVIIEKAYLYSDSCEHIIDSNGKIIESDSHEHDVNKIRTLSIDDYVESNNIKDIRLIKFDIEGGEQKALQGAIKTIKDQRPILYIPIYHLQDDIGKIPAFLDSLGYTYEISVKWTEKMVWGVDCVLFVKFC